MYIDKFKYEELAANMEKWLGKHQVINLTKFIMTVEEVH